VRIINFTSRHPRIIGYKLSAWKLREIDVFSIEDTIQKEINPRETMEKLLLIYRAGGK